MNKNSLLGINDLIWIDYILLCFYSLNPDKEVTITLGHDFPLCKRNEIVFGILIELYLAGIVDIKYINKNLWRHFTFTDSSREELKERISKEKLHPLTYYGFIDSNIDQYEIVLIGVSKKIDAYLDTRVREWIGEKLSTNTIGSIQPTEQIKSTAGAIYNRIHEDRQSKKNFGFSMNKSLELSSDRLTGITNPFLAIYILEKNNLVHIHHSDLIDILSDITCTIVFDVESKFFEYEGSKVTGRKYIIDKEKDTIFLDNKIGKIFVRGTRLDIKYGTRYYKFIEILYDKQGEFVSGEGILNYMGTIQSERNKVLGDVSSRLPDELKGIIEVSQGNYRLLSDDEILRGIYG